MLGLGSTPSPSWSGPDMHATPNMLGLDN